MPSLMQKPWLASIRTATLTPLALFLDFDGTLAPIAPRPEEVRLSPSTYDLLEALSCQIPVVLISGRSLGDLRKRVGLRNVTYVGNHGLEIMGKAFRHRMKHATPWQRFLRILARFLQKRLIGLPGIFLEDKGYTLSIHYRLAKLKTRSKARYRLNQLIGPLEEKGLIHLGTGKAVLEIRPPLKWTKGDAVNWILKKPAFRGRWPLYMGDDGTDQDAFRAIQGHGIGIWVGPAQKKGRARYHLANPREVFRFLQWLQRQISERDKLVRRS